MGQVYYLFRGSDRTAFCLGKGVSGIPDAVLADSTGRWLHDFTAYPAEMMGALPARLAALCLRHEDGYRAALVRALSDFLAGGSKFEVLGDDGEEVVERFAVGFRLVGTVYFQGRPEYEGELAKDAARWMERGAKEREKDPYLQTEWERYEKARSG